MADHATDEIDEAVDNDVILKAARFSAARLFWRDQRIGVLGAARFVVGRRVRKLARERPEIADEFVALLEQATELEPTDAEVELAAMLERSALERDLQLDTGESQLAAMTVVRSLALMTTGDKRAIRAFEDTIDEVDGVAELCGRVRCLEQLVLDVARDEQAFPDLLNAVCSDRGADKALAICFGCYSGGATFDVVEQGLVSYIADVRAEAERVLAPSP